MKNVLQMGAAFDRSFRRDGYQKWFGFPSSPVEVVALDDDIRKRILPDAHADNCPTPLTDYIEAKIHNITLALKRVNNLPIPHGAVFSFWHVVGRPTAARGFVPGRSLLAG